ncbi:MarR family transcriptional regulator [Mammaliicoccus sciuri]|uniref:MarR family transcriptional regulator n=1 Tax=Mammaliicoccus sciuri TaxID=1296 RepID=UPI000D1FA15A|nr:MarR family transcriptional regulator [Mammaliicoccus sciuri]MCD3219630.1 MarR family transcriptional regulator [Mammaliicoccus sciuri]MCD8893499.1 MarR family transcriptional regulator [Mammaliicoccus sciuri]MCD8911688.1 MarR family transcriptional regulator [Mammaliicoccus sciuri]MCJ0911378.1 MarR family transcriptional regulator [Mammaliicoccus sciuri]PTJ58927.1 MarR family transcriptional regulator [Mammaliicoccus sciuri]
MDYNMKLANQVCFSAYNVSRLFAQFYEKELKSFGLTYSQYLVLLSLWEENPQTLHSIGQKLDLSSNTLTPLLKRLEQSGWVTRQKSDQDKRQLIVSLTQKGKEQKQPIYDAISKCVSEEMDLELYKQTKDIMDQLETTLRKQLNK